MKEENQVMLPMCPPDAVGCRDALTPFDLPETWIEMGVVAAVLVVAAITVILVARRRRR